MLAIFPILCFIVIVLVQRLKHSWRVSIINGAVIWGGILAILTEALSLFNSISKLTLVICWLLLTLLFLGYFLRKINVPLHELIGKYQFSLSYEQFIYFIVLVSILSLLLFASWVYPPNNYDSMTYHMSRVVHWMQNQNVKFYPSHNLRQLYQSPWAEYAIMHFQILSNGDRFANFVQYFSMIGSLIGITIIAKRFNLKQTGQILAAIFCITIPMGILQSTTTQNDYVVSFWLVCFVYYLLEFLEKETQKTAIYLGISLGLAILTKLTAYLFAFPFLIWLVGTKLFPINKQIIKLFIISAIIVVFLNINVYINNINYFANPFGPGTEGGNCIYSNDIVTPASILSNIVRNTALHLSTPISGVNEFFVDKITTLHNYLGISVNDQRITWSTDPFYIPTFKFNEDTAGNFLHLIIITICLFLLPFQKNKSKTLNIYILCLSFAFILFCSVLRWQPWNSRLQLPLFILFSPCFAYIASQKRYQFLFWAFSLLIILVAYPYIVYYGGKPLYNSKNLFNSSRLDKYFIYKADEKDYFMGASQYLLEQDCTNIGLIIGGDDWEYPIWALLHDGTSENIILEHVAVDNVSNKAPEQTASGDKQTDLCAIYVMSEEPANSYILDDIIYKRTWSEGEINIYLIESTGISFE